MIQAPGVYLSILTLEVYRYNYFFVEIWYQNKQLFFLDDETRNVPLLEAIFLANKDPITELFSDQCNVMRVQDEYLRACFYLVLPKTFTWNRIKGIHYVETSLKQLQIMVTFLHEN